MVVVEHLWFHDELAIGDGGAAVLGTANAVASMVIGDGDNGYALRMTSRITQRYQTI